jgi:hypothetical protein
MNNYKVSRTRNIKLTLIDITAVSFYLIAFGLFAFCLASFFIEGELGEIAPTLAFVFVTISDKMFDYTNNKKHQ